MLKIAIVEDEVQETKKLAEYIRLFGEKEKVQYELACFSNAEEFLEGYQSGYQLIFMDIELPGMNGMDACRKLRRFDKRATIVFTTNLVQYAVEGYEVDAVDFMVKPIQYYDFSMKMQKVMVSIRHKSDKKIELRCTSGASFVRISNIDYVEVMRHYLMYHVKGKEYRVRGVMRDVEQQLKPYGFSRCNHSFLVNMNRVEAVWDDLISIEGYETKLPIGRTYKETFLADFTNYLGEV